MSLFDTDKTGDDRANPAPNHSDSLTEGSVKAHKTISSHYTTDADSSTSRLQMQNKQIVGNNGTSQIVNYGVQTDGNFALKFFDANGVGVARFGQYADGSIALKVAKSGQEVDTATGDNLIFNSTQDVFKIVSSGTATLVIANPLNNGSRSTVSIAHGQSSPPAVIAYLTGSTNPTYFTAGVRYPLPTADIAAFLTFSYNIDATNVNFYCNNATGANISSLGTVTFKYYLLQESSS